MDTDIFIVHVKINDICKDIAEDVEARSRSRSGKANALLNLISRQPDIDEIYFCSKDPYEANY